METWAEILALTGAAMHGEWWRLWTGHLIHYSSGHALLNAVAAIPALILTRQRWKLFWWAAAAAPLISLALLFVEPDLHYRGASALVLGAWFVAGMASLRTPLRQFAIALLLLAAVKLLAELFGLVPWSVGVQSSLAAHLFGAIAGVLGGIAALKVQAESELVAKL